MLSVVLLSGLAAIACADNPGSQDDGPCRYEDRPLSAMDLTPWGVPVGNDIASLSGPYPGMWTWAPSTDEIVIEDAGQMIEVEAVFEADPSSYRISEYVGGGKGVACPSDAVLTDGVLSFIDSDHDIVAAMPVTVNRGIDQSIYTVHEHIWPLSSFASGLTALVEPKQASIRVLVNWGRDGGSPLATFEYVGQTLDDSGGQGFMVAVAKFE